MGHEHTEHAIAERLSKPTSHSYLRDWIYGGIDGAVTTFAIVSGVVGSQLSPLIIVILGIANLIADGFSMAASNYLGTRSEHEEYDRFHHYESMQIKREPEGERLEIREILKNKNVSGNQLDVLVDHICSNDELWVSMMMHEEYGLPKSIRSPIRAAASTFFAFLVCGAVPLAPYFLPVDNQFMWSIISTGIVFFTIGSLKSKWTLNSWWYSGLITLSIGAAAASIAYIIGYLFHISN